MTSPVMLARTAKWIALGALAVLCACASPQRMLQKEGTFAAHDLYFFAQERALQKLHSALQADLDAMAQKPNVAGTAIAQRMSQFRTERDVIEQAAKQLWSTQNLDLLGRTRREPPPQPCPPVGHECNQLRFRLGSRINILPSGGLLDQFSAKIVQGNRSVEDRTGQKSGITPVRLNTSKLKPGPATLQIIPSSGLDAVFLELDLVQ